MPRRRCAPPPPTREKPWILLLLAFAWLWPGVFSHDLWKPDEIWFNEAVNGVLSGGSWLQPQVPGRQDGGMPFVYVWLAAWCRRLLSPWLNGCLFGDAVGQCAVYRRRPDSLRHGGFPSGRTASGAQRGANIDRLRRPDNRRPPARRRVGAVCRRGFVPVRLGGGAPAGDFCRAVVGLRLGVAVGVGRLGGDGGIDAGRLPAAVVSRLAEPPFRRFAGCRLCFGRAFGRRVSAGFVSGFA